MGAHMKFTFPPAKPDAPDRPNAAAAAGLRVAYAPEAFEGGEPSEALAGQFPQVTFRPLAGRWAQPGLGGADALMVALDAERPGDVEVLCANLRESEAADRVIVLARNADLAITRQLVREGVADVLTAPAGDAALVVSLERLFKRFETEPSRPKAAGKVIAFLKAGGGVGATTIATQLATIFAARDRSLRVCLADLDVQSGSAAVYLDLQDTVTMRQVVAAGKNLDDIRFSEALSAHPSGVQVLGDPQEFIPLESLQPAVIENLIAALRRDFDIVLLDLPPAWMSWTDRALRQVDRIVLVTQLSVPHAHLTRRQLKVLASQRLDVTPLTLVCNGVGGQTASGVSIKAVEKAIGRDFDALLPEDRKLVAEAINQGVALHSVKRGTKLERALTLLADAIGVPALAERRKL